MPLGRAAITRPGTQVTVIAYGLMAHYALEAAERVAEEGISVEVVDLRTLRPLDKETVLGSVRKTGKCLVVYEDNRFGGYGAEVAAIVAEEAFDYLDGPVTRIAGPDVPGVPYNHVLEDWFMVDPDEDRRRHPQARRVLGAGGSRRGAEAAGSGRRPPGSGPSDGQRHVAPGRARGERRPHAAQWACSRPLSFPAFISPRALRRDWARFRLLGDAVASNLLGSCLSQRESALGSGRITRPGPPKVRARLRGLIFARNQRP